MTEPRMRCGNDPRADRPADDMAGAREDTRQQIANALEARIRRAVVLEPSPWGGQVGHLGGATMRDLADVAMPIVDIVAGMAARRALEDAAREALNLRQFEETIGPRASAQVSENVGVLRVAEWLRARAAAVASPGREQYTASGMACAVCETPVRWIDCPTGGWCAHPQHPDDGHDAAPMPAGSLEEGSPINEERPASVQGEEAAR